MADVRRDENIAAIAAEFHSDKTKFQSFYDNFADQLSGFTGIWCYCVEAADAFTRAEKDFYHKNRKSEFEWIDSIFEFVGSLHKTVPLNKVELRKLALSAIESNRY